MIVRESIEFQRGQNTGKALKLGKHRNPIKLIGIEDEWYQLTNGEEGLLVERPDLWDEAGGDLTTWHDTIDKGETEYILTLWPKGINQFMRAWIQEEDEEFEFESIEMKDLEGRIINYNDEIYEIPETDLFESFNRFQRTRSTKRSLNIGKIRENRIREKRKENFLKDNPEVTSYYDSTQSTLSGKPEPFWKISNFGVEGKPAFEKSFNFYKKKYKKWFQKNTNYDIIKVKGYKREFHEWGDESKPLRKTYGFQVYMRDEKDISGSNI